MKEYTIRVGEVFTEEKAKELQEYLVLKDKDIHQAEQEMLKRVREEIETRIKETKRWYSEKAPDNCGLCWESSYCSHKVEREVLSDLLSSLDSLSTNP